MYGLLLAAVLASQGATEAPPAAPVEQAAVAPIPAPEQVLEIPAGLRQALYEYLDGKRGAPRDRLQNLVRFLTSPDGLGIQYQADATHTVAETFATRRANCLSFTLLTVALARELGLTAYGREIDRILSWDLSGQYVVQNTHANAGVIADDKHFVVDVAATRPLVSSMPRRIDDERLLVLFYNNRAMALMVEGRNAAARRWLDTAMAHDPADVSLWSNAGVLSLRMGDRDGAERLFLKAIAEDPRHSATLSNLVALFEREGDAGRAASWRSRAERSLRGDPFYQFMAGQEREKSGDYEGALRRYRRAVDLDDRQGLFHFGLARVHVQRGELAEARIELMRAQQVSEGADRKRYHSKLAALRRMSP